MTSAPLSTPAPTTRLALDAGCNGVAGRFGLHIAGDRRPADTGACFASINPATGAAWAEFADAGSGDVDRAVSAAREAFASPRWGGLSPTRRGRLLMRFEVQGPFVLKL